MKKKISSESQLTSFDKKRIHVSSYVNGVPALKELREQLCNKLLWQHGYSVEPGNGHEAFQLTTMHRDIVEPADAFLFMPLPTKQSARQNARTEIIRQMFKAASIFVGMQTRDPALYIDKDISKPTKPVVLLNMDGSWDEFKALLNHMHDIKTVKQDPASYFTFINDDNQIIPNLESVRKIKKAKGQPDKFNFTESDILNFQKDAEGKFKPDFNVCVFCSASTNDKNLIKSAETLGKQLAEHGWGCISGMGSESMMGAVAEGAAEVVQRQVANHEEKRGYVAGSNLLRILNMEGRPDYFDQFWLEKDIYTRMQTMIKESQAFVIMPGGMGTVQELMALLLLKHARGANEGEYLMEGKDIVIYNPPVAEGSTVGFWDPLITLIEKQGFAKGKDFHVATTLEKVDHYLEGDETSYLKKISRRNRVDSPSSPSL